MGGTGNVIGAFFGMTCITLFNKVMSLMGVSFGALQIIKGCLIVAIVAFDVIKNLVGERTLLKN